MTKKKAKFCRNCGADLLAHPKHTKNDCIVRLRRELEYARDIYFKLLGKPEPDKAA